MNVERDFRYVDSGGFDECADFLEYLGECDHNWEEAFLTWINVSAQWKQDRRKSLNYWGPWNLVKVISFMWCLLSASQTEWEKATNRLSLWNLFKWCSKSTLCLLTVMWPLKTKFKIYTVISDSNLVQCVLGQRQRGVIARSVLLQPGGPLACELARHPIVLKVDDWVFCHGGLLPHHGTVGSIFEKCSSLHSNPENGYILVGSIRLTDFLFRFSWLWDRNNEQWGIWLDERWMWLWCYSSHPFHCYQRIRQCRLESLILEGYIRLGRPSDWAGKPPL